MTGQGQHTMCSSKSKLFLATGKEQHQRIKEMSGTAVKLLVTITSGYMMSLSDFNLCLLAIKEVEVLCLLRLY